MFRVMLIEIDKSRRYSKDEKGKSFFDNTTKFVGLRHFDDKEKAVNFIDSYNEKYYKQGDEWTQKAEAY